MCFSPTASFATAGATAIIGAYTLLRAPTSRALPLALMPLIFGLQQGIEGLLWNNLLARPDGANTVALTTLFLFVAQVFWPLFAPVAVLLIEPDQRRRRLMSACLVVGIGVSGYLLWWLLQGTHGVVLVDGHVIYTTPRQYSYGLGLAYLAATGLPMVVSTWRAVALLGAIVIVGCAVAYAAYWEAFVSVWCFFAAAGSVVILLHVERAHRHRAGPARI